MKDCPHKGESVALYTGNIRDELCLLTKEALNSAILDSGCSSTVAGKGWFDCFIESLPEKSQKLVKRNASNKIFKFGDGEIRE